MYLLLLQRTLIKLAYGCTKPSTTYMSKSAQKINFTHLLKLFLKKTLFNQVCGHWQDYTINFGMNISSLLT